MTGPLHCRTHVKPGESPPSPTSVPSPKLSTYILIKEIPTSEQTPWHQGFKTPHLLLYSCPKLSPFKLRNASHICSFLFRPTVIIQRCIIFLLDFSNPILQPLHSFPVSTGKSFSDHHPHILLSGRGHIRIRSGGLEAACLGGGGVGTSTN